MRAVAPARGFTPADEKVPPSLMAGPKEGGETVSTFFGTRAFRTCGPPLAPLRASQ